MRYIDAEELKRVKFHPLPYTHITPSDVDAESYKRGWNDAIDAIVDCQPTADVRENVRGEWIEKYYESNETGETVFHGMIMCSACGHVPKVGWLSNFCPNCGADMRPISALSENVEIASNLKRGES